MAETNDQATNPQGVQLTSPDNSSYSGATIPPAVPAPTVPSAPTAPVTSPTPPAATPTTPAPPKTKQEWFQHLIKMATPTQPVVTTNPDGTQTTTDARTPVSMGQLLVTGVLSGMMAKNTYRQGAYGPVLDKQAGASDAFAAGQKTGEEWRQAPQKLSDDMIARKMSTVAANVAAAHNYAAMQQAQFSATKEGAEAEAAQSKILQNTADQNNATIGASADAYDQALTDKDAPKARLVKNATFEELMSGPFKSKMTQQLMVQDGTRSAYDPQTGRTKTVPTFSLYNPDVDIKLNKDAVDRAAKINPQFEGMYEISGGNVKMNLTRYATVTHQINSVNHAEDTLQSLADSKDDLAKTLGISGNVEGKLAGVVRNNPSAMKSLLEFENATAHGGNTADQLNRLLQSDGGDAIFKALGTDRDKVTDYIESYNNRLVSARKLAEQGGMGEKAPAAQDQVTKLVDSIKTNPDLSDSDKQGVMVDVPAAGKDGLVHMTQGQVEKTVARMDSVIASNKAIAEKNALANGDPVQMQKTASNTIEGDPNDITKIASMRGNARNNAVNAIHDEAADRGLDTTQYGEAALEAKSNMWKDYAGGQKTPTGKQLVSFDNYLGHSAALLDAQDRLKDKTLGLTHKPILNMTLKEIGNQLTDDKDWAAYSAALEPVKHEIENFLAAGYATKSEDVSNMNALLSDRLPINQVSSVIRQLADTADVRLAGLGKAYVNTMGTTYPHLMSTDSQNALKRMGIQSKALPYTQALPRGWNNHQATQMTDKNMATAYYQAAGKDKNAAIALAKNNGWILQ
jgi:hypothetical protein